MREDDVVVEEQEIERVFCDDCGTECTHTYRVEPKDVCESCSDKTVVDKVRDSKIQSDKETLGISGVIFFSIIYPVVVALLVGEHEESDDTEFIALLILGTGLWTALITAAVLIA